jgi:hypothetical protein
MAYEGERGNGSHPEPMNDDSDLTAPRPIQHTPQRVPHCKASTRPKTRQPWAYNSPLWRLAVAMPAPESDVSRNRVMETKRILKTLCPFMLILMMCACNREQHTNRYTVIERKNGDYSLDDVPIVLQHDGHKYYARCNNIKEGEGGRMVTLHCNLHVGMTVECQFFENRQVVGYDLICGSKRDEKGDLAAFGENELLQIDKEEQ